LSLENEAISVDVGLRLKELREGRRISMRELARRSELSANALSMIERNLTSPSVSTLNKLSIALEVPITAFFRNEPEKTMVVFRKASKLLHCWKNVGKTVVNAIIVISGFEESDHPSEHHITSTQIRNGNDQIIN
jgi:transcriptional regulator with XRE-family HTH domain